MTTGKQVVNALHERGFIKRNAVREAEEFLDEFLGDGELGVIAGAADDRAPVDEPPVPVAPIEVPQALEVSDEELVYAEPQPVDADGVDIPTPDAPDDVVDPTATPEVIGDDTTYRRALGVDAV